MKATVKENETFNPITIELVIESEQELCSLWKRFDLKAQFVNQNANPDIKFEALEDDEIFNVLKKLVKKHNLI